eukprot:gene36420-biopygen4884
MGIERPSDRDANATFPRLIGKPSGRNAATYSTPPLAAGLTSFQKDPNEPSLHIQPKAGWAFLAVSPTDDRVLCQRKNFLMLDTDDIHYHGATHKSNNTGEVTAIGEALAWIHQQPIDPAISYKICLDSYYGIDAVDVMPERNSARISNGRLIQWAYEQLVALSGGAGSTSSDRSRLIKPTTRETAGEPRRGQSSGSGSPYGPHGVLLAIG